MLSAIPQRWLVLFAVMLAFLPVVIDMTILHVAIPVLTPALGATGTEVLWIIDIYPLLMAGLLVPMGTLADRVGTRRVLLTGLLVFGVASLLAAFSTTPVMLIGARVLLAIGGSMIMPCVLGVIRKTFEDERERAMALGLWGTVGAAGAAVGPLIGGVLLEHYWWGSVFLINVPIMLVVAPVAYALLPRREATTPGKWAFGQALILLVGIISVVYGVKSGVGAGQPLWRAGLVLFLGLAMLTWFARIQLRSVEPMLDLSLFRHPAIVAGMVMVPIMAAAAVGGPVAGYLSNRFGLRLVASMSMAIAAAALAYLAHADFHAPDWTVPTALAVLGLTLSIGLTASSIAIMGAVDASKGGAAGSLEATGYELGSGLGITLFGVFMASVYTNTIVLPSHLDPALGAQAVRSISDSIVVAQGLAADQADALIMAAKAAFSTTHSILLTTAAILIALLSVVVFLMLGSHPEKVGAHE